MFYCYYGATKLHKKLIYSNYQIWKRSIVTLKTIFVAVDETHNDSIDVLQHARKNDFFYDQRYWNTHMKARQKWGTVKEHSIVKYL